MSTQEPFCDGTVVGGWKKEISERRDPTKKAGLREGEMILDGVILLTTNGEDIQDGFRLIPLPFEIYEALYKGWTPRGSMAVTKTMGLLSRADHVVRQHLTYSPLEDLLGDLRRKQQSSRDRITDVVRDRIQDMSDGKVAPDDLADVIASDLGYDD